MLLNRITNLKKNQGGENILEMNIENLKNKFFLRKKV